MSVEQQAARPRGFESPSWNRSFRLGSGLILAGGVLGSLGALVADGFEPFAIAYGLMAGSLYGLVAGGFVTGLGLVLAGGRRPLVIGLRLSVAAILCLCSLSIAAALVGRPFPLHLVEVLLVILLTGVVGASIPLLASAGRTHWIRRRARRSQGRVLSRRRLVIATAILLALGSVKLLWVRRYVLDGAKLVDGREREDVLARRRYLVEKVRAGAESGAMPAALPRLFQGEWALGSCSMLATALTNIAFVYPETREESVRVIGALIERAMDPSHRQFDGAMWGEDPLTSLEGPHGHAAYLGHLNFMLGAYRLAGGDHRHDTLFRNVSESLARRMRLRPCRCTETYPGELYPMDNVVAHASLRNYDRVFGTRLSDVTDEWLEVSRSRYLDPATGLLYFRLDGAERPLQHSRGSSSGWNSFYLPFIDREFAEEQYARAKTRLLRRVPFAAIREHPSGAFGLGDIDSGPVIFGLSLSGTGFLIGGAVQAGDTEMASALLRTAELAGWTVERRGKRRYLMAPLVGEAILLAMKTARVWDDRFVRGVPRHE